MASNVQVAVRIRPLVTKEIEKGCMEVVSKTEGEPQVNVRDKQAFTFNHVFGQSDTQQTVYAEAVEPMIGQLFKGYNATILAYGQTGSGKTFTMGTSSTGDEGSDTGVIPRAVREIFEKISEIEDSQIDVSCSFYELYKEEVFDLLTPEEVPREKMLRQINLNKVVGLTEKPTLTPEECMNYLKYGSEKRSVGATEMNKQSSRSHAVFTVNLRIIPLEDSKNEVTSKFLLVDLAGSERIKKTHATGDRLKEGININKGLFVLGKVICALCDQKASHIPYRDSILTRLLQDSLGGNSITLMIACVSPADYNVDETSSTLQYANRAKNIRNNPTVNMDPTKQEIKRLKAELEKMRLAILENNPSLLLGGEQKIDRTEIDKLTNEIRNLKKRAQDMEVEYLNAESKLSVADDTFHGISRNVERLKIVILQHFQDKTDDTDMLNEIKDILSEIERSLEMFKNEENKSITSTHDIVLDNGENEFQENLEKFSTKRQNVVSQLRTLNSELALKQQLHQKIAENFGRMSIYGADVTSIDLTNDYEEQIKKLTKEIEDLKDQNTEQSHLVQKDKICGKLSEERRQKIKNLQTELEKTRKKLDQKTRLLTLQKKETERLKTLEKDIAEMKASKAKLMRQMREESERVHKWRLQKERQIIKLKQDDQKRVLEMVRKEQMHQKQQTVLKRKMEEAIATSKRLKDALDKQVAARAQKNSRANTVTQMLTHEIDVIHSIVDAKLTIKQLMEDRATLNTRMLVLKEDPNENKSEIQNLQQQIEMRNTQISSLQAQIISTDVDLKIKEVGEQIVNMSDLKAAYKLLMKRTADERQTYTQFKLDMGELKIHAEQLEEDLKEQKEFVKRQAVKYEQEMNYLQKNYEEKMSFLLREIDTLKQKVSADPLNETFVIESDKGMEAAMAETLENLRKELDEKEKRCQELEEELEKSKTRGSIKRKALFSKSQERSEASIEEIFSDSLSEDDFESDDDPEWRKTPLAKRSRRTSQKLRNTFAMPDLPNKRSFDGPAKCACKGNCSTKLCSCNKKGERCGENCKCGEKCLNVITANTTNETFNIDTSSSTTNGKHLLSIDGNLETTTELDVTPKKPKLLYNDLDITTPVYPYSNKKRKPFMEI